MTRPTIGLTSYWIRASMPHWTTDAVLVSQGYVEGVRLAGGRALVLPADPLWATDPDDVLDVLDGLLVVGGNDVAPELYGAERHPLTGVRHEQRDSVEFGLVARALARRMPVLGICRGMQVLNVVRGGTLDQHLADSVDVTPHRLDDDTFGVHEVITVPGTTTARVVGERITVHSHHHQGVQTVGEGLIVSAHAHDGVIEAIEDPRLPFCIGALWHPDVEPGDGGAPLFRALVETAAAAVS